MLKEIFLFEIRYRLNRPATYIYFGIIFLTCFVVVASSVRPNLGQIKINAPYLISAWTVLLSFIFTMINSAIMGVAIVRDFDHNTEALLFTTPIKKMEYLMGRFAGSFVILILINCAIWIGLMSGLALGNVVPWPVSWKGQELLAFQAWHYFQPFLLFSVTNAFITGALFFMSGAIGRNTIVIYTQGILLIVLYQFGSAFLTDPGTEYIAALIDPFGVRTFVYAARYWTPAEQESLLVSLEGVVLYNRLILMTIAALALVVTYYGFSFNTVRDFSLRKRKQLFGTSENSIVAVQIPAVQQVINVNTYWKQLVQLSVFYFKIVWKEIPFIAIVGSGMLLMFVNAAKMNTMYGTSSYPTTYAVLTLLNSFNLFFLILAILYSGELIWKERAMNFNLIMDALPVPDFVILLSKFVGLVLVYITLLFILLVCGVMIQTLYGYYDFNFPVYFGTLYTSILSFLVLYTLLAFFIQVLVNNKFLGFSLCVFFVLVRSVLNPLGFEHDLWQFASGTLGTFSDMNGYGHFIMPFAWFWIYWLALSAFLFAISVVFAVRGSEAMMKMRWKAGRLRITQPLIIFTITSIFVFLFSGVYIYYNTTILNKFETISEVLDYRAEYERKYRQYEFIIQPKIVESTMRVELYPAERAFVAEGFYYLKNKSPQAISDIHIQENTDSRLTLNDISFDRQVKEKVVDNQFRYFIYKLINPLQPNDSMKMNFKLSFITHGFVESNPNTDVVFNGTFFSNTYFPRIGYNKDFELSDNSIRLQQQLTEKERMHSPDDPQARMISMTGDDADHIRFEMTIGTEPDQIALSPGALQKEWMEGKRKYFHYKMKAPMSNFYSVVSARYAVKHGTFRDTNLEIYYRPGHEYNLDRMMKGMKDALKYCEDNFGPFQFKQLRITEFPRYTTLAQSFAGTIPFSEGVGFVLKVADPDTNLDVPYYVTLHEVAHQWWGHQVMSADVKGGAVLSESLSQYIALMVLKHTFPPEIIQRYLKYELDSYLTGRAAERNKEPALQWVEGQNYIHYNKGSLIFYALQDYIGEDSLNAALQRYHHAWAFKDAPYPAPADLIHEIRKVTPDSLQYLIHDMFETITLFENKALSSKYEKRARGGYEVTLTVSCEKIRADSTGREMQIPVNDWMDIGVYAKDQQGKDKLIYLEKHKMEKKENTVTIFVAEKPEKAGIDPLHKLIDRHSNDNVVTTGQFVEIGNIPLGF